MKTSSSTRCRPQSSISLDEKRHRNRSLGCISRYSACPLPGFSAYLGSITRVSTGQTTFHPYGVEEPLAPQNCVGVFTSMYCSTPSEYSFQPMFSLSDTPPLVSPEPDDDLDFSPDMTRKKESASSGYGSAGSESEHDLMSLRSDDIKFRGRLHHRGSHGGKANQDLQRRRSMPPMCNFENDVTRILCQNGYGKFETNVDTGEQIRMEIRGMSRPESVLQLVQKFGEISAAQDNEIHKSRLSLKLGKENNTKTGSNNRQILLQQSKSGPPTPIRHVAPITTTFTLPAPRMPVGGIASLKSEPKMSRPNMFKQMEKVGANPTSAAPPRQLNPNSIKDALLRWIQNRVAGYPNVNVTNFSSSWADGMAFCALIHRFAPQSFDFSTLDPKNRRQNFDLAFKVAEDNGIFPLLEVDDMIMMGDRPDWKCVFTYVQSFYKQFRDHP
ncbi:Protein CBG21188 [Caenorhabditis briggsae]|uniref:Protein CBG21188 n=1 Tax=Caenorhabditis briggsae TaxID=6238 RepID=A8XZN2_CAEBR|nr:Protein CBG21188 [Caenorhabditis briggsae]CAP38031.2 Protein CBG21188 [Caenorhabditis briggsae]